MFVASMAMQIPRLKIKDNIKITVFVSWAAFGVVPTIHWYFEMGGSENSMVDVSSTNSTNPENIKTFAF